MVSMYNTLTWSPLYSHMVSGIGVVIRAAATLGASENTSVHVTGITATRVDKNRQFE